MEKNKFENLLKRIFFGEKPLIFLDTSAIIDFEKEEKESLEEMLRNRDVFISQEIMQEIEFHRNIKINAYKMEISKKSIALIENAYSKSTEILKTIGPFVTLDNDEVSEKVHKFVESMPKKRAEENASIADIGFVTNALTIYSAICSNKSEKLPTSLIVFSGDYRHILFPLSKLRESYFPEDKWKKLYLVNSKKDRHGNYQIVGD